MSYLCLRIKVAPLRHAKVPKTEYTPCIFIRCLRHLLHWDAPGARQDLQHVDQVAHLISVLDDVRERGATATRVRHLLLLLLLVLRPQCLHMLVPVDAVLVEGKHRDKERRTQHGSSSHRTKERQSQP